MCPQLTHDNSKVQHINIKMSKSTYAQIEQEHLLYNLYKTKKIVNPPGFGIHSHEMNLDFKIWALLTT
jgi:hypothetical protein